MSSTGIVSSPRGSLSAQKILELAKVYLENAFKASDPDIALVLCHDTEVSLFQAKRSVKRDKDHILTEGIVTAYIGLGKLLEKHDRAEEAEASFKKAEKYGWNDWDRTRRDYCLSVISGTLHSAGGSQDAGPAESFALDQQQSNKLPMVTATVPDRIFPKKVRSAVQMKLPDPDERLVNTPQLVCCLSLLKVAKSPGTELEPTAANWVQTIEEDTEEQERLIGLSTGVLREFKREEIKDAKIVAEVVCLAPILDKDLFRELLNEFYSGIEDSPLLNLQLEGIARLIQGADPGYLSSDDLVKILKLLSTRLKNTRQQSSEDMYQLTLAVSHILDAMADIQVTGLDREK
ncbi:hypothetical protein BGX34_004742, partial [Mortierella sp. NVP85]